MLSFGVFLPYAEGFFHNLVGKISLFFFLFLRGNLFKITFWASLFFLFRLVFVFLNHYKKYKKEKEFYRNLTLEKVLSLAKEKKKELPSFTIFIPAREEVLVVKNTLLRISQLNYPLEKMKIVVITDEKERLNRKDNEKITQEEVEETIKIISKEKPALKIHHLEIPYDYDGRLFGQRLFREVPSTKGRALNYGLSKFHSFDFSAFFDTDDYPDKNCLLAVAYEYLKNPKKELFQMPIFQCRNFFSITTFSKIIALGQSFTHEFFLPWILTWLPFLGGTNFFIKTKYLIKVGGFRLDSITEDLELGVRLYLQENIWPYFLPLASSEQTPFSFWQYFRQRQRWGLGQMKVLSDLKTLKNEKKLKENLKIKANRLYWKLIFYGPLEWFFYFLLATFSALNLLFSLGKNFLVLLYLNDFSFFHSLVLTFKQSASLISLILKATLILIAFSFYLYLRYRQYIYHPKINFSFILGVLKTILEVIFILPFILFLYPLPFVSAFFRHFLNKKREPLWVKTPRTAEG